jgi:hypothetical protein
MKEIARTLAEFVHAAAESFRAASGLLRPAGARETETARSHGFRSKNRSTRGSTPTPRWGEEEPIGRATIGVMVAAMIEATLPLAGLMTLVAPAHAQCDYREIVLADNPVAYWRLGETSGTMARDEVGPGPWGSNPGTYVGAITLGAAGAINLSTDSGMLRTDPGGFLEVPDSPALNFAGLSFSLEAWVRKGRPFGSGCGANCMKRIVDKVGAGTPIGYGLDMDDTSIRVLGSINLGPGGGTTRGLPYSTSVDEWYHLVVSHAQPTGQATIYVNGTAIGAGSYAAALNWTGPLRLGASSTGQAGFVGAIDEVAIYGYALSATQVERHYFAGTRRLYIAEHPSSTPYAVCTTPYSVRATGVTPLTYTWQIRRPESPLEWIALNNGPVILDQVQWGTASDAETETVRLHPQWNATWLAPTLRVRCIVSSACGSATSNEAVASFCAVDFDDGSGTGTPDSGVTIDDQLYYLQRFEAGC